MKEIQKRMLLQICIGFFIGRVDLFGINPAGVAYFAAGYAEEVQRFRLQPVFFWECIRYLLRKRSWGMQWR